VPEFRRRQLLPSAPRTAHLPQPQQEGVAKQTQRSLPTQTPAVTAKAAASARPMHAMPVAQVAQRSLLGKTSCSGGMHQDAIAAIKSGRSGVNKQCCDELQDSVAGLQTMALISALDADVDKKCLLRTSKHPKASIEGGSAMGEWKDVVTALRKQQRMGPDAAVDQIRVGRAGRGKRIPVASQRRTSGRSEVSDSIPADAADPTPALAYPGAFENMSFDQRCECCRLATTSNISRDFSPLPNPKPGDWLSCQEEKGQSVKAFMSRTRAMNARPGPARMTLYVQPLGSIDLDQISAAKNLEERRRQILQLESQKGLQNLELMLPGSRFLQLLESFLRAFYLGMKVKILPYKQIDLKTVGSRGGKDDAANEWQLNAGDILYRALPRLSGQARAHDGYAFVGVTVEDLYPRDDWNFVFGLADPLGRTSVFSFARYADEGFLNAKAAQARLLKRAVKVMAHEIGHTFGLMHCIHYSCLMQGSISAEESDAKPHELCPLCLRKLFFQTEFDPVLRYEALIEWIEALDGGPDLFAADSDANEAVFGEWKAWYRRRIDACG